MASFVDECKSEFRTMVPGVIWALLTLLLSLSGPFGSYEAMALPGRFVFWAVLVAVAVVTGTVLRAWVNGVLGLKDFRRGTVLISILQSILFAPPLYLMMRASFGSALTHPPGLVEIWVFIFCTSLGIGAFRHAIQATVPAEPALVMPALPRLVRRLPVETQGDLVSISVRDHYVDVRTSAGQGTLLMRFSDAIAEADGVDGAQVHRSHWVAWAAVTGVEKAEGKLFVLLSHGARIPVSRNHKAKLEARGLL